VAPAPQPAAAPKPSLFNWGGKSKPAQHTPSQREREKERAKDKRKAQRDARKTQQKQHKQR
jgi:hypothetical protein